MGKMESPQYKYNYDSESTNSDASDAGINYRGEDPRNVPLWSTSNTQRCDEIEKLPTRVPTIFTKPAVLARKQRLKKKQYVQDLEKKVKMLRRDNEALRELVESNSAETKALNRQVKYLKSVLANSSDLLRLMRNIHHGTGMSVTTSLDDALAFKSNFLSKNYVEQDMVLWNESTLFDDVKLAPSDAFTTIENQFGCNVPPFHGESTYSPLSCDDVEKPHFTSISELTLNEHNYNAKYEDADIGICLHVSKRKVSLEFCPTCSENAAGTWDRAEGTMRQP